MGMLRLPRMISEGMVLQQKKKAHIWGWNEPGRTIMVSFLGEEKIAATNLEGKWELWLYLKEPGGPYTMHIADSAGEEIVLPDVWIGDVWMCSGQSNMELPMRRVAERYQDEIDTCCNPAIRTYKILEHADFHGPLSDHLSGEWKAANGENILDFSATAYFFAREMYRMTKIPIGLINASLGGSRIESWMSREMLEGYDELLAVAEQYADDAFVEGRLRRNEQNMTEWHTYLQTKDRGVCEGWEQEETDVSEWKELEVPCLFRDTPLAGFIGSIWLRREFVITDVNDWINARLYFGTLVDSDVIYVNGVKVGQTDYQYPPRKYDIPEGVLRKGENTIVIRLKCENGEARITPGKELVIRAQNNCVDLSGTWLYRIGATCKQIIPTDFVNWKPTGLYNGMTAPCHPYTIAGFLWYQGEANARMPECLDYLDLMKRLIAGYREEWDDVELPFFYVQLPNFQINVYYGSKEEGDSCWAEFREQQRMAQEIPGTGMVVAIDLGEDNDLHPLNKKDVGSRLAQMAAARLYGYEKECGGPKVKTVTDVSWILQEKEGTGDSCLTLVCEACNSGLYAYEKGKGKMVRDFELLDEEGKTYTAQVEIAENKLVLTAKGMKTPPVEVRYCFDFTYKGALIYNGDGFPMSPFVLKL